MIELTEQQIKEGFFINIYGELSYYDVEQHDRDVEAEL